MRFNPAIEIVSKFLKIKYTSEWVNSYRMATVEWQSSDALFANRIWKSENDGSTDAVTLSFGLLAPAVS